jgi:hypothetical protein
MDDVKVQAVHNPMPIDISPSRRVLKFPPAKTWLAYSLTLITLSWNVWWHVDEVVVDFVGVFVGLTHWFSPPLTTSLFLLGVGHLISLANAEKLRDTGDVVLWQDIVYAVPNLFENLGTFGQYVGEKNLFFGSILFGVLVIVLLVERRNILRTLRIGIGFSTILILLYLPGLINYYHTVAADIQLFQTRNSSFPGRLNTSSLARLIYSATLPPPEFQAGSASSDLFLASAPILNSLVGRDQSHTPPDIFVVLNESQFDPRQLTACNNRRDCSLSMYSDKQQTMLRGPLHVHTHGWGTWNAEFTLMTGVPYYWFGDQGFYSPYTAAPRISMALGRHLSSLGYRTIGIYPTQKGMLNAAQAYRHYGIQEFFGAEDLGLSLDWCKVPDQLMYDKLIERYRFTRTEDNRPIFMVMLTVFNHGPHGHGCMDTNLRQALGDGATDTEIKLEDYLSRSSAADSALASFIKTMLDQPSRILLLFAGDHQPSFEGLASNYLREMHRPMSSSEALMFTNYEFLSNYETGATPQRIRELDISFLASSLLDLANLPLGTLFESNLKLRELCNGRLDTCPSGIVESYKANLAQIGFYK